MRMLLKSWASPPAIRPNASIFSAWWRCSSSSAVDTMSPNRCAIDWNSVASSSAHVRADEHWWMPSSHGLPRLGRTAITICACTLKAAVMSGNGGTAAKDRSARAPPPRARAGRGRRPADPSAARGRPRPRRGTRSACARWDAPGVRVGVAGMEQPRTIAAEDVEQDVERVGQPLLQVAPASAPGFPARSMLSKYRRCAARSRSAASRSVMSRTTAMK